MTIMQEMAALSFWHDFHLFYHTSGIGTAFTPIPVAKHCHFSFILFIDEPSELYCCEPSCGGLPRPTDIYFDKINHSSILATTAATRYRFYSPTNDQPRVLIQGLTC